MKAMNQTRKETILVVEDDAALRELLTHELDDHGYHVVPASDVSAALQALRSGGVDLVISDLRLPGGSGLDVLAVANDLEPRPAVILVTAFGSVPQAVEALKHGADDFLTKPVGMVGDSDVAAALQRDTPGRTRRGAGPGDR